MFVLVTSRMLAQSNTNELSASLTNTPPIVTDVVEKKWVFSVSAEFYLVQDGRDYVQPTFTADRDWLHLEARYNNEALDTGSIWLGYNFSFGDKFSLDFTPVVVGIFGDITGVAPGYELTMNWWKLELYSEAEFIIDLRDSADGYFYTWSELSFAPVKWFEFGFVVQRTEVYQTNLDIQRGVLIGLNYKQVNFTTYIFNPAQDEPVVAFSVSWGF